MIFDLEHDTFSGHFFQQFISLGGKLHTAIHKEVLNGTA